MTKRFSYFRQVGIRLIFYIQKMRIVPYSKNHEKYLSHKYLLYKEDIQYLIFEFRFIVSD